MTAARARAYRPIAGGRVIRVAAESVLESVVTSSGAYELVDVDEGQAEDEGTGGAPAEPVGEISSPAGEAGPAPVDVLPPVPAPAPAPAVESDPAAAALLAAAYELDTAEGVNSYLDDHPYAAALVLDYEAANKARKGILHGRHGTPAVEPAAE